jgi:hypothetical protein
MLMLGQHNKHTFQARKSKFRHEIYKTDKEERGNWQFDGLVTHSLAVRRKVEESMPGVEEAVEILRNDVLTLKQEQKARQ